MSVQKLNSGRYRARVKDRGHEVASKVFERHADARRWEAEQQTLLGSGGFTAAAGGRGRLDQLFPRFMDGRRHMAQRTQDTDRGNWNRYVQPEFGRVPLIEITDNRIRRWIGLLLSGTYRPGVSLSGERLVASPKSEGTAHRALSTLSAILGFAVDDRLIQFNPAQRVTIRQGANHEPRSTALDEDSLRELHEVCQQLESDGSGPNGRSYADLVLFLGFAGLRWGELAGLEVRDVSISDRPQVSVNRTLVHANGGGAPSMKAVKGYLRREVPLPPPITGLVADWVHHRDGDEPLFATPKRARIHATNWRRKIRWKDSAKAIGIPSLRPHDLRHTCATLYLKQGVNPKVVQRILGHADVQTTLKVYSHVSDADVHEAALSFQDLEV